MKVALLSSSRPKAKMPTFLTSQLGLTVAETYKKAVMSLGPVGYWRLGEASGTDAIDETGERDGNYEGTVSLGQTGAIEGDGDTAAAFDGTSGVVRVPSNELSFGNGPLTILFWVKFDETSNVYRGLIYGPWFIHRKPSGHGTFPSGIAFGKAGGSTMFGSSSLSDTSGWHFVAITYNGGTSGLIYIDGVEDTEQGSEQTIVDTTDDMFFALDSGNSAYLDGLMDEVAMFDKVLTESQIQHLYELAAPAS